MTLKITKKRHQITFLSILTAAVLVSSAFTAIPSAYSQTIIFQDDYSTNAGWTQIPPTGVNVVKVDDPSFPGIVKFNMVPDGSDIRVHKSIGTTLSDTDWVLESEFLVNALTGNPPAHNVFALSAGTQNTILTNQDMIGLYYTNVGDPGIGLHVIQKDGASTASFVGSKIIVGIGEKVFLRLARTSDTTALFEVFSDAARTLHVTGSPVVITGILPTVVGLNTLQHANDLNGGLSRNLTAEIDNTIIFEGVVITCNGLTPTIEGTSSDDILIGTSGDDVIVGLAGMDYIIGNGGNDTICGGDGDDFIRGGEGDDYIDGDKGKDLIMGDEGNDILKGSGGDDRILGGSGADTLKGNNGKDMLSGNSEDDILNGGNGVDVCDNSEPSDTLVDCEISN